MSAGTLFVVSTPIGNLGDITYRAVETLRSVDAILAEDTRHSRPLLDRYDIRTPVSSLHEHNEREVLPGVLHRLQEGQSFALISDAGTPLLSDPGARLVAAAVAAGITVTPIPGASALLTALVASGLFADDFTFVGFLPKKGPGRREGIERIIQGSHPTVVHESPARLAATLADLAEAAGGGENRRAVVARELTKLHEEFRRGTLAELARYYRDSVPRGEIVVVVDGADAPPPPDEEALAAEADGMRAAGASPRDIAQALTERGASRNVAYRLAHQGRGPGAEGRE